jgi:hypothetical protein
MACAKIMAVSSYKEERVKSVGATERGKDKDNIAARSKV